MGRRQGRRAHAPVPCIRLLVRPQIHRLRRVPPHARRPSHIGVAVHHPQFDHHRYHDYRPHMRIHRLRPVLDR